MQSTSVMTWLRDRRAIAFLLALVLVATVAVGLVMGSTTTTAASGDDPAPIEVVADDDLTLAGTSWSWFSRSGGSDPIPPVYFFGPSWG